MSSGEMVGDALRKTNRRSDVKPSDLRHPVLSPFYMLAEIDFMSWHWTVAATGLRSLLEMGL